MRLGILVLLQFFNKKAVSILPLSTVLIVGFISGFYYVEISSFLGGSDRKQSACNAGDPGLIPGLGRSPGEGNGNPLQLFLPGESHGRRSMVGYSPWGHKESDTAERLHFPYFLL